MTIVANLFADEIPSTAGLDRVWITLVMDEPIDPTSGTPRDSARDSSGDSSPGSSPNTSHDPFAPPRTACEVQCVHCGESYESWRIEWREDLTDRELGGTWCCPTTGCDGIGFGFDIFPVDPAWTDENGEHLITQFSDDDEGDDDDEDGAGFTFDNDEDEDADASFAIDTFDADAFWIDVTPFLPAPRGNTPQPPFGTSKSTSTSDDELPF